MVHPTMVVTVSSTDLFTCLTSNLVSLARAAAEEGEVEEGRLGALAGTKLLVREQVVEDCASLVTQHTAYSQYLDLTMQGGVVDSRHKSVHTSPSFITAGAAPFLSFNDRHREAGGAAALASTVVSTVRSGLFRVASGAIGGLWGGGAEPGPRPDPEVQLGVSHAVRDDGRQGLEVLLAPNKVYAAVRDAQNRVMVVETASGTVVQAWRGYHRVTMAWTVTSLPRGEEEPSTALQLAVLLILYLPRRGLLEVWSPEQKLKVTEFHVSQHGALLTSPLAALDDGTPRRREAVAVFAAFLPPSGVLQHLHIPFHALSTSSTAERDLQLQAEALDLAATGAGEADRLGELLLEIRNPQLRCTVLAEVVVGENRVGVEEVLELLTIISKTFEKVEGNISIENKVWRSKVLRMLNLTSFYQELVKEVESEEKEEVRSMEEQLCHALTTDVEEISMMLEVVTIAATGEQEELPELELVDFLSCFELEGGWGEQEGRARLRRQVVPTVGAALAARVSRLVVARSPEAQDHFIRCGTPGIIISTWYYL